MLVIRKALAFKDFDKTKQNVVALGFYVKPIQNVKPSSMTKLIDCLNLTPCNLDSFDSI